VGSGAENLTDLS